MTPQMNPLKRLSAVALLVLTLSMSAYAGEIGMPGLYDPPPHSASVSEPVPNTTTGGNIDALGFTQIALDLLMGAISIF